MLLFTYIFIFVTNAWLQSLDSNYRNLMFTLSKDSNNFKFSFNTQIWMKITASLIHRVNYLFFNISFKFVGSNYFYKHLILYFKQSNKFIKFGWSHCNDILNLSRQKHGKTFLQKKFFDKMPFSKPNITNKKIDLLWSIHV